MSTTLKFRNIVNLPVWRHEAPNPTASNAGYTMAFDLRNGLERDPLLYYAGISGSIDIYNPATKGWLRYPAPAGQAMNRSSGATAIFHGGCGPAGLLLAGSTDSMLVLDNVANGGPANVTNNCSRAGSVATVTQTAHGFRVGDYVSVAASSDVSAVTLGLKAVVSVPTANSFTFTCLNAGATTLTLDIGREVAAHGLAERGDGKGYFIRVISTATGKTVTRRIIANTAGCAPTVWLDSPLPFTPTAGDRFEILSGRVYLLDSGTGASAANTWRYYDVATGYWGYNLAYTGLPVINTDSALVALAECHVPWDRRFDEGFFGTAVTTTSAKCIQATASGASSITGSDMPTLAADEYRNFQVRIVEDLDTPSAVGQRRRISTHTSGSSAAFTVATAWTVTPSSTAKFVVENDNDKIICRTSNVATLYTYRISENTWNVTDFAQPTGANNNLGVLLEQAFGLPYDETGVSRHSYVYQFRGGSSFTLDRLDLAGSATGVWKLDIQYSNRHSQTTGSYVISTGSGLAYDPCTNGGSCAYMLLGNAVNGVFRFCFRSLSLSPWTWPMQDLAGSVRIGNRVAIAQFQDGSVKLPFLYVIPSNAATMQSALIQPNVPSA